MKQRLMGALTSELQTVRSGELSQTYGDAAELAAYLLPDTPVHCFSPATLLATLDAYVAGFPGEVSYAVKSNDGAHVLATLAGGGLNTYDVASVEEMAAVRVHAPRAIFHYHNPVKGRNEIALAADRYGCVRFAADCVQEIDKIVDVAGAPEQLEIAIRFKLAKHGASAHDFSSKFGATVEQAQVLLRHVVARGAKPLLTFHPGSQCSDPAIWAKHIHAAAEIALGAGVRLHGLNVGGGFPSRYVGTNTPKLSAYFECIAQAAAEAFGADFVPPLECEPGRGLVASSTSVLARVKLVKHDSREIYLNDGIYGSLMEVSQVPSIQPFCRAIASGREIEGADVPFTIYGPTCDPLDVLPRPINLPSDIAEGDFVEFGPLGAYGTATSTRFNGYGPAEVVEVERVLAG